MNKINTIIANHYQIIQVLGEGGSGIIYQAKDLKTSKNVANKAISLKQIIVRIEKKRKSRNH